MTHTCTCSSWPYHTICWIMIQQLYASLMLPWVDDCVFRKPADRNLVKSVLHWSTTKQWRTRLFCRQGIWNVCSTVFKKLNSCLRSTNIVLTFVHYYVHQVTIFKNFCVFTLQKCIDTDKQHSIHIAPTSWVHVYIPLLADDWQSSCIPSLHLLPWDYHLSF